MKLFYKWYSSKIGFRLSVLFLAIFLFCFGFFNYIQPNQIGIARNRLTGDLWLIDRPGIYFTGPWIGVARINTNPIRVSVQSFGRGYSAKLIQFDKIYWKEFITNEGWRYYWWDNRFSFNSGHRETYRGVSDTFLGYAYSTHLERYPFIKILEEYESQD